MIMPKWYGMVWYGMVWYVTVMIKVKAIFFTPSTLYMHKGKLNFSDVSTK